MGRQGGEGGKDNTVGERQRERREGGAGELEERCGKLEGKIDATRGRGTGLTVEIGDK